jgi:hypothetical protein
MKTKLLSVLCGLVVLGAMSTAQGALLYYEGFDYTAGPIHGAHSGWTDTSGKVAVSATNLTYPGLATEGGSAAWGDYEAQSTYGLNAAKAIGSSVAALFQSTTNVFYYSLLIGDTAGGTGNRCNLTLTDDTGEYNDDGIFIGSAGTTGDVNVGIHDIGTGEQGVSIGAASNTHMVLCRITMKDGDDEIAGLLNPTLATVSDSDFSTASTATGEITATTEDFQYLSIYIGTWWNSEEGKNTLLDEIRIGTTLGDVIIPEPATLAVLGLGGLVPLLLWRRRR